MAQLRRQSEQHRSEVQNLEEMISRLVEQRGELHRKLEALGATPPPSNEWNPATRLAPIHVKPRKVDTHNALGLSDYSSSSRSSTGSEGEGKESVSPRESSASSASVSTHRSPSFLSPTEARSRTVSAALYGGEAGAQLPRLKADANAPMMVNTLLPPMNPQWMHQ